MPHIRFLIRDYLKHLQLFHAHQPSFKVTCEVIPLTPIMCMVYIHDLSQSNLATMASLSEVPTTSSDTAFNDCET